MANDVDVKAEPVPLRCEDCKAQFRAVWRPGDTCPRCDSENYAPIPVVKSGRSDYEKADRSKAFALEDVRFGRLAQWAELVTPKQVQRALHEQQVLAAAGQKVPDLAAIFLRDKALTKQQVDSLLGARRARPRNKDDADFGTACVRLGYLSPEQLESLIQSQREAEAAGHDALPLPLLVYEKRLIQENQILALLKNSERAGTGLLYRAKTLHVEKKESPLKPLLGPRESPYYWLRAVGIMLLPIIVVLLTYRFTFGGVPRTLTQCTACLAVGGAPDDSVWPLHCTECKKATVYPLAICLDCGHKFPAVGMDYGVSCPKCHSKRFRHITDRLNLKKIEAEIKAKQSAKPKE